MDILSDDDDKRQIHPMLKNILRKDVQITKKFLEVALKTTALRSLRNHAIIFEVSCHGIVWLASWIAFILLFNNSELYQLQVNMLLALLLDIVVIAIVKAIVRRRRPVPMNKQTAIGPDKYSFPSGHASRAFLVGFILIVLNPISIFTYPPLIAWVVAVSLSRVLLERHYLLDVLAGIGIGLIEGLFISCIWLSQSTSAGFLDAFSDEKRDGGDYHV